jgi:hypothetical protein
LKQYLYYCDTGKKTSNFTFIGGEPNPLELTARSDCLNGSTPLLFELRDEVRDEDNFPYSVLRSVPRYVADTLLPKEQEIDNSVSPEPSFAVINHFSHIKSVGYT